MQAPRQHRGKVTAESRLARPRGQCQRWPRPALAAGTVQWAMNGSSRIACSEGGTADWQGVQAGGSGVGERGLAGRFTGRGRGDWGRRRGCCPAGRAQYGCAAALGLARRMPGRAGLRSGEIHKWLRCWQTEQEFGGAGVQAAGARVLGALAREGRPCGRALHSCCWQHARRGCSTGGNGCTRAPQQMNEARRRQATHAGREVGVRCWCGLSAGDA